MQNHDVAGAHGIAGAGFGGVQVFRRDDVAPVVADLGPQIQQDRVTHADFDRDGGGVAGLGSAVEVQRRVDVGAHVGTKEHLLALLAMALSVLAGLRRQTVKKRRQVAAPEVLLVPLGNVVSLIGPEQRGAGVEGGVLDHAFFDGGGQVDDLAGHGPVPFQ